MSGNAAGLITRFDPRSIEGEFRADGFEGVENLSPGEQKERYFTNREDGLRPLAGSYFAHLRVRA